MYQQIIRQQVLSTISLSVHYTQCFSQIVTTFPVGLLKSHFHTYINTYVPLYCQQNVNRLDLVTTIKVDWWHCALHAAEWLVFIHQGDTAQSFTTFLMNVMQHIISDSVVIDWFGLLKLENPSKNLCLALHHMAEIIHPNVAAGH